ncbi:hypothetical protein M1O19_01800 [Dehalococcoidia bacterium]|nr:hypothetical protein [Dehalococcoidia bacterium]
MKLADRELVVLRQTNGKVFAVSPVDEFDVEVVLLKNNPEFMALMEELSQEPSWATAHQRITKIACHSEEAKRPKNLLMQGSRDSSPLAQNDTPIELYFRNKVVTIHCIRPTQFSERGAVEENFAARIAQLADQVIVHLESQKAILTELRR